MIASAWLIGCQAIFALSTLIGVRLLSDLMPPAAYGELALLIGLMTLGRYLFAYPFLQAAIRFYPDASRRGESGILRRLVRSSLDRTTALLAIVYLLGGALCYGWKPMSLLQVPLLIGVLFVDNLRSLETDLLIAARRERTFAIVRASEAIFRVLGAVLMVLWLGPTPAVVLLGYLLGGSAVYAGLFVFRVERIGVWETAPSNGATEASIQTLRDRIWRYSLPLVPVVIMDWVSGLSDRYLIGGLVGLEAAGIYAAAYGLMNQPFLIAQASLELIFRSRYFDAVSADDVQGAHKIFTFWIILQATVCVIGVVVVAFMSSTIASLCLGSQYQSASRIMPYIAAGNAMLALFMALEKVFHARRQTTWCLSLHALGAGLSVAIGIPMIVAFGIVGAALAVPIYYGLQVVACILVINKTGPRDRVGRERTVCEGAA